MLKGSIARASRVLDILALAPGGVTLSHIVAQSKFNKTTTFRVLASLQDVNYVSQDPQSREYRLGLKLTELARTAARTDIAAVAQRGISRLADMSEDTVFLSIPESAASVCIARHMGAFPIRTLTLDQGDRRPLGVGAGSLALYCAMDDAKRSASCRINQAWLEEYGFSEAHLEAQQDTYKTCGYALNRGQVVPGMSAVAVPILTNAGHLAAAIAIGAIDERMRQERIETVLLPALRREAALLVKHLSEAEKEPAG